MKLAISNIAWSNEQNTQVYSLMKQYGFSGLEIAPTKIISEGPYDNLLEAGEWYAALNKEWGFSVPSMQSIWFGRQERIFGTENERAALVEYTKKAIDFAQKIGCRNLVFGCPRNRSYESGIDVDAIAVAFFKEIADYAYEKSTCVGMEANPPIYNTNFINDTQSAIELIKKVDSRGFKLNLDMGTMIHNQESVELLRGNVGLINHIHISEPGLKPIEHRDIHKQLMKLIEKESYRGYVSIEMSTVEDVSLIENAMKYVADIYA